MAESARTLEDYYRERPADNNQMHRWLGCRDAYAEIICHARREAGYLREQLRLMNPRWVRRRDALTRDMHLWESIANQYDAKHKGIRSVYDASAEGAKRLPATDQARNTSDGERLCGGAAGRTGFANLSATNGSALSQMVRRHECNAPKHGQRGVKQR